MTRIKIGFKKLNKEAKPPTKAHNTDTGFDLYICEGAIIEPNETVSIPTGIAVEFPQNYDATVRPRSGITRDTKLRVQIGTVDQPYRGDIGITVDNIYQNPLYIIGQAVGKYFKFARKWSTTDELLLLGGKTYKTKDGKRYPKGTYFLVQGDKLAQLCINKFPSEIELYELDELSETDRGEKGFGKSGVR